MLSAVLHRWDRGYAKYGPLEWLGFFIPCVSWLRKYSWADNLLVHPATPSPDIASAAGGGSGGGGGEGGNVSENV